MCRFLAVVDSTPFDVSDHVRQLAVIARGSREYQGDGWGCAWLCSGNWRIYRNIQPIWEDDLSRFGRTTLLLAHARSAFRDEAPDVENNMPFIADSEVFVFNGELQGVRLREPGRIGAEKLFNFLRRFEDRHDGNGLARGIEIVKRRTRYVKAMNFVMARRKALVIHSHFSEAADYFTVYKKRSGTRFAVCSEPFPGDSGWKAQPNNHLEVVSF